MASKTNTLDWEEARAEFFQETFLPSESLNSNTSTALRRQNEAQSAGGGASSSFRDASVGTLESHSSRMSNAHLNRSQASTTPADAISPQDDSPPSAQPPSVVGTSSRVNKSRHMRAAVQGLEEEEESDEGEIEVVDFTDENLATEVESWQNQKRLRDLALPLSQKKNLRLQYEKCPKIKLNRLRAMKFACKRLGHWCFSLRRTVCQRLTGWSKPLVCVDRHRGGEMFTALQLHKILAFITIIVCLTVLSFLLLPYMLFMCDFTFELCGGNIEENSTLSTPSNSAASWRFLHQPYFYYSFFNCGFSEDKNKVMNPPLFSSFRLEEHFPLIYLFVSITCQLGLSLYVLRQLVILIKGVTWEETADTWFKSIFSSWNHNMVCQTSSTLKHRSIYRQIKQKIQLSRTPTKAKTFCTRCLVVTARCLSLLFTLVIWAGIISVVHLATLIQLKPLEELLPFVLPNTVNWRLIEEAMIFFLPVVLVVLIRLVIMPISQLLDKWEYYPFNTRVMAYSCRLFFSRAVAMFTLVTSIYHRHQGSCWEDHFCDQMLALVVADFIVDCLLALVIRFPRVLLSSLFKRRWSCSTKLDFDPYESIVDLVVDFGLLLLGVLYCPLLPFFLAAKLCLGYGVRLFHIWVNCSASRNIHSPSCIRFLFIGFSAVMVLFSNVIYIYALLCNHVSEECGPFKGYAYLAEPIPEGWHRLVTGDTTGESEYALPMPREGLSSAAIAAYILAALIAVLIFGLYISHLKRLSIERDANELKCQLAIATQEKCYLISKIKRPNKPQTATT